MNLSQFEQYLTHSTAQAILSGERMRPVMAIGPVGAGKTYTVRRSAQAVEAAISKAWNQQVPFGMVSRNLSGIDIPDVQGATIPQQVWTRMPKTNGEDDPGATQLVTKNTLPSYVPTDVDPRYGFMFFDELPQASEDLQRIFTTIVDDHAVNDQPIPLGWRFVMAGNRAKDQAGVRKMLAHFRNKVLTINIDYDVQSMIDYWLVTPGDRPHSIMIDFARSYPELVVTEDVAKAQGEPFATPRSFVEAWKEIARFRTPDEVINDEWPSSKFAKPFLFQLLSGWIGKESATKLGAHVAIGSKLPKLADILAKPTTTPIPTDAQLIYMLTYMLIGNVNAQTAGPLLDYLTRPDFPSEFQTTVMRKLIQTPSTKTVVATHPRFGAFVANNAELIQLMAQTV